MSPLAHAEQKPHSDCATEATNFLGKLTEVQLKQAKWPFETKKRRKWTYFPNVPELDIRTEGLAVRDMTNTQRIEAHELIECGLSNQGYQKAAAIMRMDDILGQTDLYRPKTPEDDTVVDSEKYWLALFGDPTNSDTWGWQLEGHHLALNFTVVDGKIIFAPAFMGADPARVNAGRYAGWRILGDEVDFAFQLLDSFDADQIKQAIVNKEIPERLFTAPGREDSLNTYLGINASELNDAQLKLLTNLIETYVKNASAPIALEHQNQILKYLPDETWFTWMGSNDPGNGIYYRIHSPAVLIEFVTARNRQSEAREPNPNHVHSIFAYPGNNYGDDYLRRHYQLSKDHQDE
ncbi:MAG: DUF3500 domain-containing protein [Pseudomonadota bacterium]|nr:DUF3500 domain-containing protein [Pseudomonadota bacterium]